MQIPRLIISLIVLTSLSCSSAGVPAQGSGESVRVISRAGGAPLEVRTAAETITPYSLEAPADQVWQVLPQVYEKYGIELSLLDPERKMIGNTRFRPRRIDGTRLSQFFECGRGMTATPNADRYDVTVFLVTTVREDDPETSTLLTEVNASAKPRDVSGSTVHCASKGTVELRIADAVREMLQLGTP
jgi:hypothetical protein